MSPTPSHFDAHARHWDSPERVALGDAVSTAMRARLRLPQGALLDYGAGTGLVTFAFARDFARILAVDASEGMRAVLTEKRDALRHPHVEVRDWDLEREPPPPERFDVVVSSMTLHHIRDTGLAARVFRTLLRPGGQLTLVDLDQEDGTFHKDNAAMGVRHLGFARDALGQIFQEAGFEAIAFETAHVMDRPGPDGTKAFPLFLLHAVAP